MSAVATTAGLIVIDLRLDEPSRQGLFGPQRRPVPEALIPGTDEALVLRTGASYLPLWWGEIPDPTDERWLDAQAATRVRRHWRQQVTVKVPSNSADRDFVVMAPLNCRLISPVSFLTSADPDAINGYRDHVAAIAREQGKRFDARESHQFESALRVQLQAWLGRRRREVPGVVVELGTVEVLPPETAVLALKERTNALWSQEQRQLDHQHRLADERRQEEERIERARNERRALDDESQIVLTKDSLEQERYRLRFVGEKERERVGVEADVEADEIRRLAGAGRALHERAEQLAEVGAGNDRELLALEGELRQDEHRRAQAAEQVRFELSQLRVRQQAEIEREQERLQAQLTIDGYQRRVLSASAAFEEEQSLVRLRAEIRREQERQQAQLTTDSHQRRLTADNAEFAQQQALAQLLADNERERHALEAEAASGEIRRQMTTDDRKAMREALEADAASLEALLRSPEGLAALALARGEISGEKLLDEKTRYTRWSEAKFYSLLGWLIENDGNGDLELGDAGRHLVLGEITRLNDRLQNPLVRGGTTELDTPQDPSPNGFRRPPDPINDSEPDDDAHE